MSINKEWHRKNKIPKNPSREEKIKWHQEHEKHCDCRPMPDEIKKEIKREELNEVSLISKIQKATGLKIDSCKIIKSGTESLIAEVNGKWIFRFPKNADFRKKMEKRLEFLVSFSKVSPLRIPEPKYIESDFIGYEKIPGKPFRPTNVEKLIMKKRLKIAKQLGLFLKALHSYRNEKINFDTGYLVMGEKDYKPCPKLIAQHLNTDERKTLNAKLRSIAKNPRNSEKPTTIIHGDLYFNNILWDPNKKVITGILDWAEAGLGIPAMDFIALADFSKNKNDQFLKDVLSYYGAKDDDLFFQIKEDAIIEVMNWFWFYYKEKNRNGMDRIIKKLKKILA